MVSGLDLYAFLRLWAHKVFPVTHIYTLAAMQGANVFTGQYLFYSIYHRLKSDSYVSVFVFVALCRVDWAGASLRYPAEGDAGPSQLGPSPPCTAPSQPSSCTRPHRESHALSALLVLLLYYSSVVCSFDGFIIKVEVVVTSVPLHLSSSYAPFYNKTVVSFVFIFIFLLLACYSSKLGSLWILFLPAFSHEVFLFCFHPCLFLNPALLLLGSPKQPQNFPELVVAGHFSRSSHVCYGIRRHPWRTARPQTKQHLLPFRLSLSLSYRLGSANQHQPPLRFFN